MNQTTVVDLSFGGAVALVIVTLVTQFTGATFSPEFAVALGTVITGLVSAVMPAGTVQRTVGLGSNEG